MGQHDLSYRLFFSHVRMVCDLLREMIGEAWVERIDFASAERVNTSFVSEKRSSTWKDVLAGVARLQEHVGPQEPELRRAFEGWIEEVILPRLEATADEIPGRLTLEELEPMLAERIDSWNEQLRRESLHEGVQKGEARALLRLLEKRFGPVDQTTRDRIAKADAELLLEWIDRFPNASSLADIFSG